MNYARNFWLRVENTVLPRRRAKFGESAFSYHAADFVHETLPADIRAASIIIYTLFQATILDLPVHGAFSTPSFIF